mgnify:CR=1 FL=1
MTTWLSPYLRAYARAFGEPAVAAICGRMAKALRPLEAEYSPDEIAVRFTRYLQATPARYYSVEHFVATFPAWRNGYGVAPPGRRYETVEEYVRRTGNG